MIKFVAVVQGQIIIYKFLYIGNDEVKAITSFLTSFSILLLSEGFSDNPFNVLVINSPTVLNSFKPKPLVVAASETLKNNGFKIYSDGTDTHLMLVDLRPYNVKGNLAAESLSRANITCNKNGIPFDTEKPMITSGIRLGTQAATTRGFKTHEFKPASSTNI